MYLIEQTYPSGRVVKNVLDNDGDLSLVQSGKCLDAASATNAACINRAGLWNYADSFTYNAAGAVTSMQLGNGRWESTVFNSRLQPTQIALGATQNGTNLLKLNYDYGTTNNNGNVLSQTITVPTVGQNQGFTAVQNYTYDSLNRLASATETIGGNQSWKQTFTFDRYGNRKFDTNNTTTIDPNCPVAVCNPDVNPANNRLIGYTFDAAGNTTVDAEGRQFIYDAENKQTEVKDSLNQTIGQYSYDGDGRRVKKFVPSTGETTVFVYDASNRLVAEYSTVIASSNDAKVAYLTNDHLGSPRINTDENGLVISRRDFHPFGEEIVRPGYGQDTVHEKFATYERDNETDLDYAQARYYGNKLGRFTTVDAGPNTPADPQSHNRYPYVQNNPLKFRDPSGNTFTLTGSDANELVEELEKKTGYKLVRDKKTGRVTIDKSQKREKKGTSKKLAGLLKKIVGDKKTDVALDVGKNQTGVFYDSFSQRKLDLADHNAINAVAPELAADSLGHVLKEYYTAEKKYAGKSDSESFPPSHQEGLKFESKVLSDFTRTKEMTAVESQPAPRTIRFTYTSVYYDILLKSGVPGGAIDTVDMVTKVEIKQP